MMTPSSASPSLFLSLVFTLSSLPLAFCSQSLRVVSPATAVSQFPPDGSVPEVPALFGNPPYGRTITAQLYYHTTGDDEDGCFPIDKLADQGWPPMGTPLILMLDRGSCSFVTKVRNAQIAGALAAIVVDNVEESIEPYMADDGTGADITIPSVLISLGDGQKLKASLAEGIVTVLMQWNLPNPDAVVEWTLWTSSNDPQSVDFKHTFGQAVDALGDSAVFTAHYVILNGSQYDCYNTNQCGSQCINNGLYCAVDPDQNLNRGVSGAQIIEENLRQICIFQVVTDSNEALKWWDYVIAFQETCAPYSEEWNKACSDRILDQVVIDRFAVETCVSSSQGEGDRNTLLDAEIQTMREDGIFYLPTVMINTIQYRGSLTCPTPIDIVHCGVLEAICSGYAEGSLPCACESTPGCQLCEERDPCGICGGNGQIDSCGQCLPVDSLSFDQSCAGCDGVPNSGKIVDPCGVCGGTGSYDQCFRCLQADHPDRVEEGGYDACGVCLSSTDPARDQSCAGCDGVPNSGLVRDACGKCGGQGSFDACYRCLEAGDPARIEPNQGGFDDCGVCMRFDDPRWNRACTGCDGVVNSGFYWDACGNCTKASTASLDKCGRCLQANDPSRVDDGGYDACGACLPLGDPARVNEGEGGYDQCGLCMKFSDPRFDKTCAGCDGVPNSGAERDACGVCQGDAVSSESCGDSEVFSTAAIIGITASASMAAMAIAFCCFRIHNKKMQNDIDAQIRRYQQMGGSRAERLTDSQPVPLVQGQVASDE